MAGARGTARAFLLLTGTALLAGCSVDESWQDALAALGMSEQQQRAPLPVTRPTRSQISDMNAFCRNVVHQDGTRQAFDITTRQRVYQIRLTQCESLFGDNPAGGGLMAANPASAPAIPRPRPAVSLQP